MEPKALRGGRMYVPLRVLWERCQPDIAKFHSERQQLDQICADRRDWPDDALLRRLVACVAAPERRLPLSAEEENHCAILLRSLQTAKEGREEAAYSWVYMRALLFLTPPQIARPVPELLQAWLSQIMAVAIPHHALISVNDDAAMTRAALGWCMDFASDYLRARDEDRLCGGKDMWPYWRHMLGHQTPTNIFYASDVNLKNYAALCGKIRAEVFAATPAEPVARPTKIIGTLLPKRGTRRRIGLLCHSTRGHGHGLPHLLWWLACMDRERFEPVLILQHSHDGAAAEWDALLRRYPTLQDYAPIIVISDTRLPELAQFGLDLLYYFQDFCQAFNEQPAYLRLARKQMTGFYTPATTGIPTMDCFLTSPELEKPFDNAFTEQVILTQGLPFCFHYQSYLGVAPRRNWRDADIPDDATVYVIGSSQQAKLRPEFADALMKILQRTPGSYCLGMPLYTGNENIGAIEMLQRRARQAGVDPDRIRLSAFADRAVYHGLIASSDVFLDYFPFSGTNNLCDPVALGKPCVVLCPEVGYSRNRIGGMIMRTLGLDDLVVKAVDSYIELAVKLGTNPALRQSYRERMGRSVLENSPLCDGMKFMDRMHQAFAEALGDDPVPSMPRVMDLLLRERLDREFGDFSCRPLKVPEVALTHDFVVESLDFAA